MIISIWSCWCDDFLMTNEPLGGASGATQLWNDHISFNGIIQWTSWPLNCEMTTFYLMILLSNWPLNCDMITSYLMMWSYRPTGQLSGRRPRLICSLRLLFTVPPIELRPNLFLWDSSLAGVRVFLLINSYWFESFWDSGAKKGLISSAGASGIGQ